MARITQTQIDEIMKLYAQIGTYSGVAEKMGIAASTVSKYVKLNKNQPLYNDDIKITPIENIPIFNICSFSTLTPQEEESFKKWLKEFNINGIHKIGTNG